MSANMGIVSKNFMAAVHDDIKHGRYSHDYIELTRSLSDPDLLRYLENWEREPGQPRHFADVDHRIPQGVWRALTGLPQKYVNVASNLKFRDPHCNRAYDQKLIKVINAEAQAGKLNAARREYWIELLLFIKEDESSAFGGVYVDHEELEHELDHKQMQRWLKRRS